MLQGYKTGSYLFLPVEFSEHDLRIKLIDFVITVVWSAKVFYGLFHTVRRFLKTTPAFWPCESQRLPKPSLALLDLQASFSQDSEAGKARSLRLGLRILVSKDLVSA